MRKRISLLLVLGCLVPAGAAQRTVRYQAKNSAHANELAQRKAEEAQRRAQAIDILKGVIEAAPDIKETHTRVAVLTNALDLLWKHDEAYTRASFIKSAAAL